jgi:hypothetical protein
MCAIDIGAANSLLRTTDRRHARVKREYGREFAAFN